METITQRDIVEKLTRKDKPLIGPTTQFVLIRPDANFPSPRDGLLTVQINQSESAKTTRFETDGQWTDGVAVSWSDGWTKQRTVADWSYVVIENAVKQQDGRKLVQTCYANDKPLLLALREAVGLPRSLR